MFGEKEFAKGLRLSDIRSEMTHIGPNSAAAAVCDLFVPYAFDMSAIHRRSAQPESKNVGDSHLDLDRMIGNDREGKCEKTRLHIKAKERWF